MADKPQLSLTEIAGINMSMVEEVRFEVLPEMAGHFEVKEAKLDTIGQEDNPAIIVENAVLAVESAIDVADPQTLVGKVHREVFFVRKAEDIGRFKAWLSDAGVTWSAEERVQLDELLPQLAGLRYPGKIKHRRDKNDKERIYANVIPIKQEPQPAASAAR